MSLLEAFYYTFASDASALDKGLSESEKKAEQLKKTVSGVDAQTEKLGTSFLGLAKTAAGLLGVTLTLAGAKALAMTAAETTSALGMQARQMNVNVSQLDAWRKAVTESGGDAEAFTRTLGNMAQRFRDPEAALLRYSQVLGGMSSFRAQRLGKTVGLDEGTIELLRKGKIGVEELIKKQKAQGGITQEQVEQSDRFNQKLRTMKMEFDGLKMQIGTALIPIFENLLDAWNKVSDWVKDHKEGVQDFFIALGGIIAAYYLPTMISAAAATLAAVWPFLLIGAAVAALALVVADLIGYFTGMDSVTGRLAQKFPELDRFLQASKEEVIALWDALVMLFTDPLQFLENLKNEIKTLFDSLLWEGAGDTVFDFLGHAGKEISDLWRGLEKLIGKVVDIAIKGFGKIGEAWKTVKGWFGSGNDEVEKAEATAQKTPRMGWEDSEPDRTYGGKTQLQAATATPITSMTSNAISNTSRQVSQRTDVKVEKIEVNTQATDAQGIANGIGDQLEGVIAQNTNGIVG